MIRWVAFTGALLLGLVLPTAQTGTVRIRVTDPLGRPISEATASLLDTDDRPVSTMTADESGEILWTGLPPSEHRFGICSPGFSLLVFDVTVRGGVEQKIEANAQARLYGMRAASLAANFPLAFREELNILHGKMLSILRP